MGTVQRPLALRFGLLGHIRAFVDGEPFAIATPRKTAQLLTYLLLHRGATVARDHLAFLFWPDDTEESARSKLRSNIFDLTRLLPAAPKERPWVSADGTSVRWNGDAGACEVPPAPTVAAQASASVRAPLRRLRTALNDRKRTDEERRYAVPACSSQAPYHAAGPPYATVREG